MRAEEAKQFHEEDEDAAKVFALFDAARREGRLRKTQQPPRRDDLMPLNDVIAGAARELRREMRELRLVERLGRLLEHLLSALRSQRVR